MAGIQVLHVGAHEELIMNYFRNFELERIQFDYVLRKGGVDFRFKNDPCFDGKLYYITPMQTSVWRWMRELRAVIRANKYSHVHLHFGWANIYGLIAGIGLGSKIISHNHSYYESSTRFRALMRGPLKYFINVLSDYKLACSVDAGRQLFNNDYILLPNAIDYSRFKFKSFTRGNVRSEFAISEISVVFGHVGNFIQQKNHLFLIQVFSEIRKVIPESILLLVGADYGTLEVVKEEVNRLGLDQYVVFAGDRSDVESLLCAFDVFLFPSLYEGFGMALLEAEVSGLPCVFSSSLPKDAVISTFCQPCDLKNGAEAWAVQAIELCNLGLDSDSRKKRAMSLPTTFDVVNVAHQLEDFYLSTAEIVEN
jgi:glycosyltransferase involved in cell wall biosynthesis